MPQEKQEPARVTFERPLPAHIMAIDGTWKRVIKDISETSSTLLAEGSVEGLVLKEFFLLISTGLAYRRCQLERVNGDQMLFAPHQKD